LPQSYIAFYSGTQLDARNYRARYNRGDMSAAGI
jgi:hypothetical protein